MKTYHILCSLFVVVYTQGALQRLGVPSMAAQLLVEVLVAVLAVHTFLRFRCRMAPGWVFVALFAIWTLLSGMLSGDGSYLSFLYFRMFVHTYLVFWAVWNAGLTRNEVFRMNRLLVLLWILQIVASVGTSGEQVEGHVGTIASLGGGAATAFPLFAMSYVMAFYFYRRRSLWAIVLALSFGLVGYASGKRAVYFLMPFLYACTILWYCFREKSNAAFARVQAPILLIVLASPVIIFGLTNSKRFADLKDATGVVDFAVETTSVVTEYTLRGKDSDKTSGRTANSLKLLKNLPHDAFGKYLFGLGPACMMNHGDKRAKKQEGIIYGVPGWVRDTISLGWPAMLLFVGFHAGLWRKLARRRSAVTNDYAKAVHFGTHLAFLAYFLLYFLYCDSFVMAGWFSFVHFYFLALVLSPNHQHLLQPATARQEQ
jgi:hypothetical protein